MGMTHIRLSAATEDVLEGALRTAWKLRIEKNAKPGAKKRSSAKNNSVATAQKSRSRTTKG